MKKALLVVIALVFALSLTQLVLAAEKIGYVDLKKILSSYEKTKKYDSELLKKQTGYEGEREKKISEIKQLQDSLVLLKDKEKESKQTDIENKVRDLKVMDDIKQSEIRKEYDSKLKEVFEDIDKTIKEVAKQEGCSIVYDLRTLLYIDESFDITDKVLTKLNSDTK